MIKIYAALAILLALTGIASGIYYVGYQNGVGSQIKLDNAALIAATVKFNERTKIIKKNTIVIAKKQAEHKKSVENIPLIVASDCDIDQLSELWDESAIITNSVHFSD